MLLPEPLFHVALFVLRGAYRFWTINKKDREPQIVCTRPFLLAGRRKKTLSQKFLDPSRPRVCIVRVVDRSFRNLVRYSIFAERCNLIEKGRCFINRSQSVKTIIDDASRTPFTG